MPDEQDICGGIEPWEAKEAGKDKPLRREERAWLTMAKGDNDPSSNQRVGDQQNRRCIAWEIQTGNRVTIPNENANRSENHSQVPDDTCADEEFFMEQWNAGQSGRNPKTCTESSRASPSVDQNIALSGLDTAVCEDRGAVQQGRHGQLPIGKNLEAGTDEKPENG